jgi:hypothetical protein
MRRATKVLTLAMSAVLTMCAVGIYGVECKFTPSDALTASFKEVTSKKKDDTLCPVYYRSGRFTAHIAGQCATGNTKCYGRAYVQTIMKNTNQVGDQGPVTVFTWACDETVSFDTTLYSNDCWYSTQFVPPTWYAKVYLTNSDSSLWKSATTGDFYMQ